MKVLGLVLELNPFHKGHKYFIDKAIEKVKPDLVIAVVSSSYTNRGDISVIDKFTKTSLCLENNINLVLELPFISAVQSADFFCFNAIKILSSFKTTDIVFGSESGDISFLENMAELIDKDIFQDKMKYYINQGQSYSVSAIKTISELTSPKQAESFSKPNNTLGIGYIRASKKMNNKIHFQTIQRKGSQYYDKKISDYPSATSLRLLIDQNKKINDFIPNYDYQFISGSQSEDKLLLLLKYKFASTPLSSINKTLGVNEGIENRIKSFLDQNPKTLNELIKNIQTKRYSFNTIKRMILHILLNTPKRLEGKNNYYLRILGMDKIGKSYLNTLPKTIKEKIITSPKNINNPLLDIELKATKLYSLLSEKDIFKKEYVIIKKEN